MSKNILKRHAGAWGVFLVAALLGSVTGCTPTKPAQGNKTVAFWPPYPDEPRVQFLISYSQSTDVVPAKSGLDKLIYGKEAEQVLPISKPYGVGMWKGKIYVCDIRNNCVVVLDLRKHQTLMMGKSGADTLATPTAIAIAPEGTKYVSDIARGMIYVFDAEDRLETKFTAPNLKPTGVAIYQNELYVCDFNGKCVLVMDRRSGKVLRTIGEGGGEWGKFVSPLGCAVDAKGNLFVMDFMKCQLQKFDHDGRFLFGVGATSNRAGGLVKPKHIAVDKDGIVYAVDAAFQNVQLYDGNTGQVLTFFGSSGAHPGAMFLPAGVCVTDEDLDLFQQYIHPAFQAERLVLVTNQFGDNKVSVYAMGRLKPGKTVADISATKGVVTTGVADPNAPQFGALPGNTPATLPGEAEGGGSTTQPSTQPATPEAPSIRLN